LFQSVTKILNNGANVNDTFLNGHRPLQLLIKFLLGPRKKLELVKRMVDLGADIHCADKSALTPLLKHASFLQVFLQLLLGSK
jgi:hypothetical protein